MTQAIATPISDIACLGEVLDALEAVPDSRADAGALLPGAAAIGRRVAALADEAFGSLPNGAAGPRQALAEAGRLGQAIGVLDAIPERTRATAKLLRGAAALGRSIAGLAIAASDAPASEEASAFARARSALAQALKAGEAPQLGSWTKGFRELACNVEHGGVLIGGRFFSCPALQPMHGERVIVLAPNSEELKSVLVLELDSRLIGVALPELIDDGMRPVPDAHEVADAFAAELGDEVAGRARFPHSLGVAGPADSALGEKLPAHG